MKVRVTLPAAAGGGSWEFKTIKAADEYIQKEIPINSRPLVNKKITRGPELVHVECHTLSDGRAEVSRIGRMWFFTYFPVDSSLAPEESGIISKEEAYKRLEEILKKDVLELD